MMAEEAFFTVNDRGSPLARYGREQVQREFLLWDHISPGEGVDADASAAIIASALGISAHRAERLGDVVAFLRRLPRLRALQLELFHLDMYRLEGIWRVLQVAKDELLPEIDGLLVELLTPTRPRQELLGRDAIMNRIKAMLDELDPEISTREKSTRDCPEATTHLRPDGIGELNATYSAEIVSEIDQLIRKKVEETGLNRADALLELIRGVGQVRVVLNVYTAKDVPEAPVYVPGVGWQDATVSAELRERAEQIRDLDGAAQEVGTAYQASPKLRAFLIGRDGYCRFPGCTVPAQRSQVEHCADYAKGGATSAANCAMFCQHHHNMKTDGRFSYELHPETGEALFNFLDGTVISTMPQGPIAPEGARWVQTVGQRREQRRKRAREEATRVIVEERKTEPEPPF